MGQEDPIIVKGPEADIVVQRPVEPMVVKRPGIGDVNMFGMLGEDGKTKLMALFPTGDPKELLSED